MVDKIEFFSPNKGFEVLARRARIIQDLLSFIREGCEESHGNDRYLKEFLCFENAVNASLSAHFQLCGNYVFGKKHVYATEQDDIEEVVRVFKNLPHWAFNHVRSWVSFHNDKLNDRFLKEFDIANEPFDFRELEENPSLYAALQSSLANLDLAETRMTCLNAIVKLVDPYGRYELQISPVFERLYERMKHFSMMSLLFANMLQDEGTRFSVMRRVANRFVIRENENESQFSSVQHITRNGIYPGMYMTAVDDKLRTDFRQAINRD